MTKKSVGTRLTNWNAVQLIIRFWSLTYTQFIDVVNKKVCEPKHEMKQNQPRIATLQIHKFFLAIDSFHFMFCICGA